MKKCVIDERELWNGEKFWVIIDETNQQEIMEFYENEGKDIETARIWAKNNGYSKIEYI